MEKREKKRHRFLRFFRHPRDSSPDPAQASRLTSTAIPKASQTPSTPVSPDPLSTTSDPSLKGSASVVAAAVNDGSRTDPHKTNESLKLAVEEYIKGLTPAEKAAFRYGPSEDDLLARAAKLDDEHKGISSFRAHTQKIAKVLQLCNQFMPSVTIGIQANPDISSIVVGGVRLVLDIGLRFATFFDRLTDMISRLTDYLKALAIYGSVGDDRITAAAAATYGELLRFCQRVNSIFVSDAGGRKSTVSIFFKQLWEPFETTFGEMDATIKHHFSVVDVTANAVQLDWLKTRGKSEDKDKFLTWLAGAGADFDERHIDVFSKKHPGTADWLLNSKKFESWIDSPESSLLWCYGKAGTGKSVIASNVIEHFLRKHLFDTTVGVSYVYYHHTDGLRQDLSLVIAGMLLPICRKLDEIPDWLNKHRKDGFSSRAVCRTDLFCAVAQKFKQIIVVIDGLDECRKNDRGRVISFLDAVLEFPKAKVVVMSRKEDDIVDAFESLKYGKVLKIELRADDTIQDIKTYVTESVRSLRKGSYGKKLHLNDESLERVIVDSLVQNSRGMFLWAYFQLEHLCEVSEARQDRQIREALDCLPSGLNETYIRMLHDIEAQPEYHKRVAQNTLMWILNAKGPLSGMELQYAVSLSLNLDSDPGDVILVDRKFLVNSCRNLVVDTGQFIGLVHYSAQQFMESSGFGHIGLPLSSIENTHYTNELLAYTCLSYLRHISFQGPWGYVEQAFKLMADWPFCVYAAQCFDSHVEHSQCARRISKRCLAITDVVFKNQGTITAILLLRRIRPPCHKQALRAAASSLGTSRTDPISVVYSSNLIKVDQIAEKYCTLDPPADALHLAAANGDEETTRFLIDYFWETNKLDDRGNCALYYPCESGHAAIVSMLLEHRADPNVACGFYGSPLQAASAKGHEEIVKILLDHGAQNDVRNTKAYYSSALDASIQQRNQKITRLLIDSGVDINAPCGVYGTALQTAIGAWDYRLANELLDEGADVNANTATYGTAVAIASSNLNMEMVTLLLDRGADINALGGEIGSPLQAAISAYCVIGMKDMRVVNLLLERGADVKVGDERSGTALMAAAAGGDKTFVNLLIDKGANVNAQGGKYGSPLQAAVQSKDVMNFGKRRAIVDLLLNLGADINARGGDFGTALHCASSRGLEDIVELLIDRKADVNIVCPGVGGGSTPLAAALRNGHMKIAAWLIAAGTQDLRPVFWRNSLESSFVPFEAAFPDLF
ncbi:hypothetical protein ACJ73_02567 [Blastomyces percursus]|uniref:Nephrocystin 3-like N-terminal domain-containing protein n=1 Tax=Blastomyces percursus TaxID=1658174 RepID=A0A1J9RDH0_9EURO|nr:hypothetical protein ACJ73_02567 [Blastomyces percursus]